MSSFGQDVRLALRRQRRAPGFTATVVLTLALGIGCATAVLTVANALLLRRLPVANQDALVVLAGESTDGSVPHAPLGMESALAFANGTHALSNVALLNFEGAAPVTTVEGDRVVRLQRSLVSGNYFTVLGADAVLGRALRPEDDLRGAPPVVVISNRAWRAHYGSAFDIVGRHITTREDGITATIVGVMPVGLDYPRGVDVWIPVKVVVPPASMGFLGFDLIGRLAHGVTVHAAQNALTSHFQRDGATPSEHRLRGQAVPIAEVILGNTRPALFAFLAAAALLLLITCLNVANLLLVRALSRRQDLAVRLALGASRGRLVREVLTEQAILAMAGGVLGTGAAIAAIKIFVVVAPAGLPRLEEIQVDGSVLASAFALAAVATLLSAVVPTVWAVRGDARLVTGAGLGAGQRHTGGRTLQFVRELLVAGQLALALLVLSGAGLLGRSLWNLERVDLAFDASRLLVADLAIPPGKYDAPAAQAALYDRLELALESLPGVQSVSPVVTVPFAELSGWKGKPAIDGQSEADVANNPWVDFEVVAPSFFRTLGLPVQMGRAFTQADRADAPLVAVLSESAARRYWPTGNPIGQRVRVGTRSAPREVTVVGVVPDPRYRDLRVPRPTMYFPLRQSFFPFAAPTLLLRTTRTPADVAVALRRVLAESDGSVAFVRARPFALLLEGPLASPRMNAVLLAVFATSAMALSAIGLFGVLTTTVRQRTREFGIRMALGATVSNVIQLVLRRGVLVAGSGIAVGLLGAITANRLFASLLYDVSPLDAGTLVGVVMLVSGVAALSAYSRHERLPGFSPQVRSANKHCS